MQPITILALLTGSALAATIPAPSNTPASPNTQYYVSTCSKRRLDVLGEIYINEYNENVTRRTCKDIKGFFCRKGCITSGEEATRKEFDDNWAKACTKDEKIPMSTIGETEVYDSKETAENHAFC
jgi:hypothetical protein